MRDGGREGREGEGWEWERDRERGRDGMGEWNGRMREQNADDVQVLQFMS